MMISPFTWTVWLLTMLTMATPRLHRMPKEMQKPRPLSMAMMYLRGSPKHVQSHRGVFRSWSSRGLPSSVSSMASPVCCRFSSLLHRNTTTCSNFNTTLNLRTVEKGDSWELQIQAGRGAYKELSVGFIADIDLFVKTAENKPPVFIMYLFTSLRLFPASAREKMSSHLPIVASAMSPYMFKWHRPVQAAPFGLKSKRFFFLFHFLF